LRGGLKIFADLSSGKTVEWVESLGIEPGRSYTDYSFRALLCVPENADDMQRAMVDFSDDFRPTVCPPAAYLR
jgi:hypothetical protein